MSDREPDLHEDPSNGVSSLEDVDHPTAAAVAVLVRDTAPQWGVLIGALTFAFALHAGLGVGSDRLVQAKPLDVRVEVTPWTPPPPPEPEPVKAPEPPPPPKPEPKPEPKKPEPKPEPVKEPEPPPPPEPEPPEPPPPSSVEPPAEPPEEPVEVLPGITMKSTTEVESTMKVPPGNTVYGDPNDGKKRDPKDLKGWKGGKPGGKAKQAKPRRVAHKRKSTRAAPLQRFKPRYPKQLIDEGIEGVVLLLVEVSRDGKTERIKVLRGLHPALDKLSLRAVKRFRWRPATIDGHAVDSRLKYAFRWQVTS